MKRMVVVEKCPVRSSVGDKRARRRVVVVGVHTDAGLGSVVYACIEQLARLRPNPKGRACKERRRSGVGGQTVPDVLKPSHQDAVDFASESGSHRPERSMRPDRPRLRSTCGASTHGTADSPDRYTDSEIHRHFRFGSANGSTSRPFGSSRCC